MAIAGFELAAEMPLTWDWLKQWQTAACAEAKAQTIDEFDTHIE